ncbi:MAG: c-type cytochrome [Dehalococcoidia bacterium]
MEHDATAHHNEHPPTTIRQYVIIGVVLTVITAIELWLSYSGLPDGALIGSLIALSAVKFAIVVALFMHLRFDNPLFTRMFVFGLVLAASLLFALLGLFWGDHHDNLTERVYATPGAVGHGGDEEEHVEGGATEGEGEGEPAGDPAAGMVQGIAVAEFFQTNCAACHGANREGVVGPALTPASLTLADEVYHDVILNGRPGTAMPAWSQTKGLTDEDADALVQFLKHVEP